MAVSGPNSLITGVVSILMAIIGVAIIATLVSPKAKTTDVLRAGGDAFSGALGAALSPVTGSTGFSRSF